MFHLYIWSTETRYLTQRHYIFTAEYQLPDALLSKVGYRILDLTIEIGLQVYSIQYMCHGIMHDRLFIYAVCLSGLFFSLCLIYSKYILWLEMA